MGSTTSRRLLLLFLALVIFTSWRILSELTSLHSEEIKDVFTHPILIPRKEGARSTHSKNVKNVTQNTTKPFRKNTSPTTPRDTGDSKPTLNSSESTDGIGQLLKPTIREGSTIESPVFNKMQNITINATNPYFILHVGPPKTATTTIQCGLEKLSEELAREDSYYFVGKRCPKMTDPMGNNETGIPGHKLMLGLNDANPQHRGAGFETLKSRMKWHHSQGNHMVFSIEAMSTHLEDKEEIWGFLLSLFEGWNVRVIVSYRYYFDWIRSMYYQQYLMPKYKRWPHIRGRTHPSLIDYLNYHLEMRENNQTYNAEKAFGQHLTLTSFRLFAGHFHDIRVFNLHQEGDLVTNFICQMLPTAHKVCKRLLEQTEDTDETLVQRVSQSFDADRIAEVAYERGLVDKNVPKGEVVRKIAHHMEHTGLSSNKEYLSCLSASQEARFLNASFVFERDILTAQRLNMPEIDFQQEESNLVPLFEETKAKGKFCEIDPDQVLKNEHWKTLLSNITSTKKNV